MFGYVFGDYLVEKGLISADEMDRIFAEISRDNAKLGYIAVKENLLTEEQVAELHNMQRTIDKRFGALAVENGRLTQEQLEQLIEKQRSASMTVFKYLKENAIFTDEKLAELLESFKADKKLTDAKMELLLADDNETVFSLFANTHDYYTNEYIMTALKYLMRFVSSQMRFSPIEKVSEIFAERLEIQKVVSTRGRYFIGIASDKPTMHELSDRLKSFSKNTSKTRYSQLHDFVNCISCIFDCTVTKELEIISIGSAALYKYSTVSVNDTCYSLPLNIDGMKIKLIVGTGVAPNFATVTHNL